MGQPPKCSPGSTAEGLGPHFPPAPVPRPQRPLGGLWSDGYARKVGDGRIWLASLAGGLQVGLSALC